MKKLKSACSSGSRPLSIQVIYHRRIRKEKLVHRNLFPPLTSEHLSLSFVASLVRAGKLKSIVVASLTCK
jgi:hypothetical protein